MTDLDPVKKPPVWKHETWVERLNTAASALSIHGMLSQAERDRVHKRMMKWVATHAEQESHNAR